MKTFIRAPINENLCVKLVKLQDIIGKEKRFSTIVGLKI